MNVSKFNIFNLFLILCLIVPLLLLFLGEKAYLSLIVPYSISMFVAYIIAEIVRLYTKNNFYGKIYLLTALFHLIVGLFVQIVKYYILNLPTVEGFAGIGIDNDGLTYNSQAISLLKGSNLYETSHYFSVLVSFIYRIFGINEYTVCTIHALLSGFITVVIYKMADSIYNDKFISCFLGYVIAFSFTVAAYTSVLMRDVYIFLFSYMIIYFYYKFYRKSNVLYLAGTILTFLFLCVFRPYAAIASLGACLLTHVITLASFRIKSLKIKINIAFILTIIMVLGILTALFTFQNYLKLDYIISLFDMNTILEVSEVGYGGANSSFGFDRMALAKCLPLFILVGYFCMFFAPFPHQWFLARNIVQAFSATETIILFIFLIPSFFSGVIKGFKNKNFIIIASFFYIMFVFTFYGMILDNSGAVFRGRAPFIPLIYMIALYSPGGLLKKLINYLRKKFVSRHE